LMGFLSSVLIRYTGERLMRWRSDATGAAR
jgi:hypothetical protein